MNVRKRLLRWLSVSYWRLRYAGKKWPDLAFRPEAEVSLEYKGQTAITLRIMFKHDGDGSPIYFTKCLIVFNVDPNNVPEDELVYIDMKGKKGYYIDLSEMIAAGIGWETTTWVVFKLFDLDTAMMFDNMIMEYELKQEWFLPVPEECIPFK